MPHRKIVLSVGFFILLTTILIIISLVYVIEKKGVFEAQKTYKLIAEDAEEIEVGMPVLFSGFEIGQVSNLGLHENGEVLVTISIPEHNTKWVRSGALFILEKPLIGKSKITLRSVMSNPPLDGDIILRMSIQDGINEIISNIQPVVVELQSIVSNVNALSHSLADENASFQGSLKNVEDFSSRLSSSPSLLVSLTGNEKSAKELHEAVSNLNIALKDVQSVIKNTDEGVSELREDIIKPSSLSIKELGLILKDVHEKLRRMDKTIDTLADSHTDIKYFKNEMKVLLDEMSEISTRVNTIIGEESTEHVELP